MTDQLMWRTANPLWSIGPPDPGPLRRPALLRFATDDFMTELADRLAEPEPIADLVAGPETWRDATSPADRIGVIDPDDEDDPAELKLYQPAHARFYLAGANLVCRRPGLPDHRLGDRETASFVVRQLQPGDGGDVELAWTGTTWQPLAGTVPIEAEERLPLVPTIHRTDGLRRRLLTGLVPVGARERYEAGTLAAAPPDDPDDPLTDPRRARLIETVISPLRALAVGARAAQPTDKDPIEEAFPFSVVELSDHLRRLAGLAGVFGGGPRSPSVEAVRDLLDQAEFDGSTSWRQALGAAEDARADILLGGAVPSELRLTAAELADAVIALTHDPSDPAPSEPPDDPTAWQLYQVVAAHLEENPIEPTTLAGAIPPAPGSGARYVVRCVFERAGCPIRPEWVSEPSAPFQMASFFDPDAPTRDHRIALPFDTSPAGLRKAPRNISMIISSELRKQMAKVDAIKLEQLDDGELGEEGNSGVGMVCSLSIPIITIAALILLMIIVSILNIVFWWLPLFKICFPVRSEA